MASCPHCSESITTLSGFVPQATHEQRMRTLGENKNTEMSAKNAEIQALTTKVSEYGTKAQSYDAVAAELIQLKDANTSRQLSDSRGTLLTEAKVDPSLLKEIEQVYSWSQNGVEDGAKKTFEDWFAADASTHVLLAPHFNGPPAAAPPAGPPAPGDPPNGGASLLPPPSGQPPPPPSGGKITQQDLANWMASPAYQNLPTSAEKRAKMAEWKTQIGTQG